MGEGAEEFYKKETDKEVSLFNKDIA